MATFVPVFSPEVRFMRLEREREVGGGSNRGGWYADCTSRKQGKQKIEKTKISKIKKITQIELYTLLIAAESNHHCASCTQGLIPEGLGGFEPPNFWQLYSFNH